MGQEHDAHEAPVNRERERLARVFAGYADDRRRRAAWNAANPGNAALREELAHAALAQARGVLEHQGWVLDAGCGTAWWLEHLLNAGVAPERLVGVDLLDERCAAARRRVPGARIQVGDLRRLDLPDRSCVLVTLFAVLSSMAGAADRAHALAQVRRVLVPGGLALVWEPRVPTPNRHTHLVRTRELRMAFGADVEARSITLAPPIARRAGPLYALLARLPWLRTHRLMVARA